MTIKLSQEQQEIVDTENNTIVVSNPGTGKTTTLSLKVLKLLENGVKPEKILCITFTEKAKKEMFEKIYDLAKEIPDSEIMKINIHTFHSFALNYLQDAGIVTGDVIGNNAMRFSILKSFDENNALNYGKEYIISSIVPKTENAIRYIKSFGITPDKIELDIVKEKLKEIYEEKKTSYSLEELQAFLGYFKEAYKNYEDSKGEAIDYSDMLLFFLKNFKNDKFEYVFVDEMQDMNDLEAEIAEKIGKKICLVGDSKQAIFGFQGGSIKNFKKFIETCELKMLSVNRRSCQQILDYSKEHFLRNTQNKDMVKKELECFKAVMEGASPKVISTKSHLNKILSIMESNPEKTIGIITRTNKQVIKISNFLDINNITYSSTSSKATTQYARDDIIKFLRGLILDEIEEKVSAIFTIFAPYTLKEAFEISGLYKKRVDISDKLKKMNDIGITLTKSNINDLFDNAILPVCVSKGPEWFSTAVLMKKQIEEYLSTQTPTKEGLFDFLSITEESYIERDSDSRITLTTVHKSKGLGFDVVIYLPSSLPSRTSFVDMIVEAILSSKNIDVKDELEEESIRIDFVAFTRAKEMLFVLTDDKNMRNYHIENITELEVDEKEEEIVATKMDSRMSEAFSLFVAGRLDESKVLLEKEDAWLEELIVNYFKNLDHLSYSSVNTDPYEFLTRSIISIPHFYAATTFGSEVHNAMDEIFKNKVKIEDLEGDVKKAVENGMKAIEQLKKDFPGLEHIGSEKGMKLPLSSIIEYSDKKLMFHGFIDAVFKHDNGYIIVDYKTDKNSSYSSGHKRQLSVYRKMFSVLNNIPEGNIKIFVLYLSLRGGINTGRFDWQIEGEKRDAFPTFEKHARKVLEWKEDPKKFIKDLLDNPKDDILYEAIVGKIGQIK